jgi:hypothetical protein
MEDAKPRFERPVDVDFSIIKGTELLVDKLYSRNIYGCMFQGQCYLCAGWYHYRKQCPLQYCTKCYMYGHHYGICRYG